MSDKAGSRGGAVASCNDSCGCPTPCPGGQACRCESAANSGDVDHKKCSCGDHCGCNPCTCNTASSAGGVGKVHCKCGPGCACVTCAA